MTRARLLLAGLAGLALGLAAPALAQWVGSAFQARTYTATAPANVNGFACRTAGCRFDIGPGASDYFWSNGGGIYTPGTLRVDSGLSVLNADIVTQGSFRWVAGVSLPTCSTTYEGQVARLTGTGGTSTGAETRFCACVSNGAASPVYSWRNVITGTAGNATTCNP